MKENLSGDGREERNSVKKSKRVSRREERRDTQQRADISISYDDMYLLHNQCSGG